MNPRLMTANPLAAILLACLLAIFGLPPAVAQEGEPDQAEEGSNSDRKPGITVIVEATGAVEMIESPGQPARAIQKGERVPEGAVLVTGADGKVDLALSNGAFMQIQENSRFGVGRFQQEGYEFVFSNSEAVRQRDLEEFGADEAVLTTLDASEEAWNKMAQEPTTSETRFELEYGTLIGESKKLRPGSRMDILTPIGVAGIRGTIWRLTLQRIGGPGSNQFRGTLDVGRGLVTFTNPDGSRAVDIASGFTLRVEAAFEGPGQVNFSVLETGRMTPERAAVLQQVIQSVQTIQTSFQAVQGTPADLGIVIDSGPATGEAAGDTAPGFQVDPPSTLPGGQSPGGGTGNIVHVPPQPTPTPEPTPTPTPTPSPTVSPG